MMHLFKKKKSSKTIIDALCDKFGSLPTGERIEEVVKVAIENAEKLRSTSVDDSNFGMNSQPAVASRLHSYKTAGPLMASKNSENAAASPTSVLFKPDCMVGVDEGLALDEIDALDSVEKKLSDLSAMINATSEKEEEISTLIKYALDCDLPVKLLSHHAAVSFNTRQGVANVFTAILKKPETISSDLDAYLKTYIVNRQDVIINLLLANYPKGSITLHTGLMFRECLKNDTLYGKCLTDDMKVLGRFFAEFLAVDSFEGVSDAFSTFRAILQGKRQMVSEFLDRNYKQFFPHYNILLQSKDYISQRHSLKLLSDLLLDRQNSKVMLRYISEKTNLVLIMTLMRVKSPSMRLEAFHVFKIFVANPNKSEGVTQILQKNRDKLIAYLAKLTTEREEEIFQDEKKLVIRTLQNLPPPDDDIIQETTGAPMEA